MTNDKDAKIHDRLLIINKLSILIANKCPITARLGKNESLVTTVTDINVADGTLMLAYSDCDDLNKKLISVPYVEFNAIFQGAFVSFTVTAIKKITYKGSSVFVMYIPSMLYWNNRRRHNRTKIPSDSSSFCEIILSSPTKEADPEYRQNYEIVTSKIRDKLLAKLKSERDRSAHSQKNQEILINLIQLGLYDVSQSGFSVLNCDESYSYFLTPNRVYENCRVVLPNNHEITSSFKIVSKRKFNSNEETLNSFQELVGVKFLKIER